MFHQLTHTVQCYPPHVKTYALQNISSCETASTELERNLPGQQARWLRKASDGDVIAYFNVVPKKAGSQWGGHCVTADVVVATTTRMRRFYPSSGTSSRS